ncbi:MAG: dihydrofolate reductase family protein, partial [Solirubrobacteraceae bacterium]
GAGLPDGARALTPPPLADGRPDLTTAWGELRSRHPDGLIVCEGGPRLLGQLIQQRLLDQLVLCISPHLAGGANALRLTEGLELPAPALLPMTLLDLARADDFVFLRYAAAP